MPDNNITSETLGVGKVQAKGVVPRNLSPSGSSSRRRQDDVDDEEQEDYYDDDSEGDDDDDRRRVTGSGSGSAGDTEGEGLSVSGLSSEPGRIQSGTTWDPELGRDVPRYIYVENPQAAWEAERDRLDGKRADNPYLPERSETDYSTNPDVPRNEGYKRPASSVADGTPLVDQARKARPPESDGGGDAGTPAAEAPVDFNEADDPPTIDTPATDVTQADDTPVERDAVGDSVTGPSDGLPGPDAGEPPTINPPVTDVTPTYDNEPDNAGQDTGWGGWGDVPQELDPQWRHEQALEQQREAREKRLRSLFGDDDGGFSTEILDEHTTKALADLERFRNDPDSFTLTERHRLKNLLYNLRDSGRLHRQDWVTETIEALEATEVPQNTFVDREGLIEDAHSLDPDVSQKAVDTVRNTATLYYGEQLAAIGQAAYDAIIDVTALSSIDDAEKNRLFQGLLSSDPDTQLNTLKELDGWMRAEWVTGELDRLEATGDSRNVFTAEERAWLLEQARSSNSEEYQAAMDTVRNVATLHYGEQVAGLGQAAYDALVYVDSLTISDEDKARLREGLESSDPETQHATLQKVADLYQDGAQTTQTESSSSDESGSGEPLGDAVDSLERDEETGEAVTGRPPTYGVGSNDQGVIPEETAPIWRDNSPVSDAEPGSTDAEPGRVQQPQNITAFRRDLKAQGYNEGEIEERVRVLTALGDWEGYLESDVAKTPPQGGQWMQDRAKEGQARVEVPNLHQQLALGNVQDVMDAGYPAGEVLQARQYLQRLTPDQQRLVAQFGLEKAREMWAASDPTHTGAWLRVDPNADTGQLTDLQRELIGRVSNTRAAEHGWGAPGWEEERNNVPMLDRAFLRQQPEEAQKVLQITGYGLFEELAKMPPEERFEVEKQLGYYNPEARYTGEGAMAGVAPADYVPGHLSEVTATGTVRTVLAPGGFGMLGAHVTEDGETKTYTANDAPRWAKEALVTMTPLVGTAYIATQALRGNRDWGDVAESVAWDALTFTPAVLGRVGKVARVVNRAIRGPLAAGDEVVEGVSRIAPNVDDVVQGVTKANPGFSDDVVRTAFTSTGDYAEAFTRNRTLREELARVENISTEAWPPYLKRFGEDFKVGERYKDGPILLSKEGAAAHLRGLLKQSDDSLDGLKAKADTAKEAFENEATRFTSGSLDDLAIAQNTHPGVGGLLEIRGRIGSQYAEGLVDHLYSARNNKGLMKNLEKTKKNLDHDINLLDKHPNASSVPFKSKALRDAVERHNIDLNELDRSRRILEADVSVLSRGGSINDLRSAALKSALMVDDALGDGGTAARMKLAQEELTRVTAEVNKLQQRTPRQLANIERMKQIERTQREMFGDDAGRQIWPRETPGSGGGGRGRAGGTGSGGGGRGPSGGGPSVVDDVATDVLDAQGRYQPGGGIGADDATRALEGSATGTRLTPAPNVTAVDGGTPALDATEPDRDPTLALAPQPTGEAAPVTAPPKVEPAVAPVPDYGEGGQEREWKEGDIGVTLAPGTGLPVVDDGTQVATTPEPWRDRYQAPWQAPDPTIGRVTEAAPAVSQAPGIVEEPDRAPAPVIDPEPVYTPGPADAPAHPPEEEPDYTPVPGYAEVPDYETTPDYVPKPEPQPEPEPLSWTDPTAVGAPPPPPPDYEWPRGGPKKPDSPDDPARRRSKLQEAERPPGTYPRRIAHEENVQYTYNPDTDSVEGQVVEASDPVVVGWDPSPPMQEERMVGGWDVLPHRDGVSAATTEARELEIPDSVRDRLKQEAEKRPGEPVSVRSLVTYHHDLDTRETDFDMSELQAHQGARLPTPADPDDELTLQGGVQHAGAPASPPAPDPIQARREKADRAAAHIEKRLAGQPVQPRPEHPGDDDSADARTAGIVERMMKAAQALKSAQAPKQRMRKSSRSRDDKAFDRKMELPTIVVTFPRVPEKRIG